MKKLKKNDILSIRIVCYTILISAVLLGGKAIREILKESKPREVLLGTIQRNEAKTLTNLCLEALPVIDLPLYKEEEEVTEVPKTLPEESITYIEDSSDWYPYEAEEVLLLGDLMYCEEMQFISDQQAELVFKAAGSVVLNRVAADKKFYPNTVYDVIYQGYGSASQQYDSATLSKLGKVDTPEVVYQWAEELLRQGPIGPQGLVYQGEEVQGEVWMHYGNQYFCLTEKDIW